MAAQTTLARWQPRQQQVVQAVSVHVHNNWDGAAKAEHRPWIGGDDVAMHRLLPPGDAQGAQGAAQQFFKLKFVSAQRL